jgi:hypothetical protein
MEDEQGKEQWWGYQLVIWFYGCKGFCGNANSDVASSHGDESD